ncbi:glycerol-3-phosphate 1-O-acyltransferase PlsY [Terrarubrum flagellatum]|uniref:glycerol-3-phosphate 1-O-acyltransferase PlsY n=1 Tax=Terrirubrum flagellatum TaxID=2895980 RepID=UPI003145682D
MLLIFIAGYLLGSIPFGLLLTKLAGGPDIRTIGSGNIGATNVLRTGNKKLAAATLLLDGLKGTAAALVGYWWGGPQLALLGCLGALLGHCFPVWLGFKGGKGVATFIGCLFGVAWKAALAFIAIWLAVAWLSRYSSLAALAATIVTPLMLWMLGAGAAAQLFAMMGLLVVIMHHENISRLIAGTESKIGKKG